MSPFQHILIPTDFSHSAWKAVQMGLTLADHEDSSIVLLHVFPSSAKFTNGKKVSLEDEKQIQSLQEQMDDFCKSLQESSRATIIPKILRGKVEHEILQYIDKYAFDMVILGINSNGADNHPGSHVSNIIEQANAPVMVIPNYLESEIKEKVPA